MARNKNVMASTEPSARWLVKKGEKIYTHVSTKSIQNIKSPFDDLGIQDILSIFDFNKKRMQVCRHIQHKLYN